MANPPKIGILVLNRNGRSWLNGLFQILCKDSYPNKQVFLVDNDSDDGSVEITLTQYPEVTVIRLPQDLGYCMAYNLAMPHAFAAGCDWVIWANNDIRLEPDCLRELATVSQIDPLIGIVGSAFLDWDGNEPNSYMQGAHPEVIPAMQAQSAKPLDVEWVEGSFLMVSRPCVECIGPLDPFLFFYWEETDFCRRARLPGWRVVLAPRALARHYAGGWSGDNQQNKKTANRLQSRNFYIYTLANPFRGFMINFLAAVHLFLFRLRQSFSGQPLAMLHQFRVFAGVLRKVRAVYKKWKRDRLGWHPPLTLEKFQDIQVTVLRGKRA
ncbi:MAG: glycosyltransferase family 2 protein [Deltaproteobacteria bacterium]|nr:glycosyltransferase family 2 protein [Deltaproteobacteria bacterium]